MLRALVRFEDGVGRVERLALFLAFAALVAVMFLQVLFRFFIERPLDFTEELGRILFVWLIFLGAAHGSYTGQHFMVDFIFRALPMRVQRVLNPLIDLITIAFLALVLWVSWRTTMAATVQRFPVLGLPVMVQVAALPVGTLLMMLHTLMFIVRRRSRLQFATLDMDPRPAPPAAADGSKVEERR